VPVLTEVCPKKFLFWFTLFSQLAQQKMTQCAGAEPMVLKGDSQAIFDGIYHGIRLDNAVFGGVI